MYTNLNQFYGNNTSISLFNSKGIASKNTNTAKAPITKTSIFTNKYPLGDVPSSQLDKPSNNHWQSISQMITNMGRNNTDRVYAQNPNLNQTNSSINKTQTPINNQNSDSSTEQPQTVVAQPSQFDAGPRIILGPGGIDPKYKNNKKQDWEIGSKKVDQPISQFDDGPRIPIGPDGIDPKYKNNKKQDWEIGSKKSVELFKNLITNYDRRCALQDKFLKNEVDETLGRVPDICDLQKFTMEVLSSKTAISELNDPTGFMDQLMKNFIIKTNRMNEVKNAFFKHEVDETLGRIPDVADVQKTINDRIELQKTLTTLKE